MCLTLFPSPIPPSLTYHPMTPSAYVTYLDCVGSLILEPSTEAVYGSEVVEKFHENATELALKPLKERIEYLNGVHAHFAAYQADPKPISGDLTELAIKIYVKALQGGLFEKINKSSNIPISQPQLQLPSSFSNENSVQRADREACEKYTQFLKDHPKYLRQGDSNDRTKGAYRIIYPDSDLEEFKAVRKQILEDTLKKMAPNGKATSEQYREASDLCRVGIVFRDGYWIIVRDLVESPQGAKFLYNRHIHVSELNSEACGAATLPIVKENGVLKATLQCNFRHTIGDHVFEIARGLAKSGEKAEQVAKRESKEEDGYEGKTVRLTGMFVDTGLTSSHPELFATYVETQSTPNPSPKEAINNHFNFTIPEIEKGLVDGYLEVELNGVRKQVLLQDPFLAYALYMAKLKGIIPKDAPSQSAGSSHEGAPKASFKEKAKQYLKAWKTSLSMAMPTPLLRGTSWLRSLFNRVASWLSKLRGLSNSR